MQRTMLISYADPGIPGRPGRTRAAVEITTAHPCSSYGAPVLVLEDGRTIDLATWQAADVRIENADGVALAAFRHSDVYQLARAQGLNPEAWITERGES